MAEVLSDIAYASNNSVWANDVVVTKKIAIPDGRVFAGMTGHITTANPNDNGNSGRWTVQTGVDRSNTPDQRVLACWVTVTAKAKSTFGTNIWIGYQLDVTIT